MSTTIYYPRIKSINFYDEDGLICGGIHGSIAHGKFIRMLKSGDFPKISLKKKVQVSLKPTL